METLKMHSTINSEHENSFCDSFLRTSLVDPENFFYIGSSQIEPVFTHI